MIKNNLKSEEVLLYKIHSSFYFLHLETWKKKNYNYEKYTYNKVIILLTNHDTSKVQVKEILNKSLYWPLMIFVHVQSI
jgi:hypothetical protein